MERRELGCGQANRRIAVRVGVQGKGGVVICLGFWLLIDSSQRQGNGRCFLGESQFSDATVALDGNRSL